MVRLIGASTPATMLDVQLEAAGTVAFSVKTAAVPAQAVRDAVNAKSLVGCGSLCR